MNAYELADEYEYTKKEHDAFMENPTDANRIAALCKRNEFAQKLIRQQADRIQQLKKEYDAMVMSFEARLATRGYEIQIKDQADRIAELEKAAQRMVDEFAPHADKCRPCTIEWQNLKSVLVKGMK